MSTKKRNSVIGRGLSSLLENPETDITSKSDVMGKYVAGAVTSIKLSQIEANPFQPRDVFDQTELQELAESLKIHGMIQPVTLRKLGFDKYQLITGERRFKAAQIAGMEEIPAYIRIADDEQMLEWALIENIHRKDLNPMEIAFSYQRLVEECNLTQEQLSQKVNSKRSTVTNYLRLLKLPEVIQKALKEEKLTMGHARAIAAMDDYKLQMQIFRMIIEKELSVRSVEKMVKDSSEKKHQKHETANEIPQKIHDAKKILSEKLHSPVDVKYNNKGKGKIVISFNSDDELNNIIEKLK
ncbi:MAG: ParB/RepB/Spo0J family partition protein [Bacteroidales bacterium]|jgi:ParB family chromosome partitioning protein|nr:ParB/RepB/Spo0J family partition protein [Bacteroidales bacterium]MDD4215244.1 ParB/RepB/Spo0J family partition protein [Bacteroidales bacterium]